MKWLFLVLVLLGYGLPLCSSTNDLLLDSSLFFTAEPLTSIFHPDVELSFVAGAPCGAEHTTQLHSNGWLSRTTRFATEMMVQVGHNSNGTLKCFGMPAHRSEEEWMKLATERYRLQWSIQGVPVYFIEKINTMVRTDAIRLRVTGVPAVKIQHKQMYPLYRYTPIQLLLKRFD